MIFILIYFILIIFLLLFIYIYILLIGSLATQLHRYIPENWKKITANATNTNRVTDGTRASIYFRELLKNYCKYHYYCSCTDGITYGILLMICYIYRWIYQRNKTDNFFWHVLSICKSIDIFITDGLIDNP